MATIVTKWGPAQLDYDDARVQLELPLAGVSWSIITAMIVRKGMVGSGLTLPVSLKFDTKVIFMALVLLALATIFRRGAELEDDQALVV